MATVATQSNEYQPIYDVFNDPGEFARRVLNMGPMKQQDELFNAIRDNDRVTARSGHGIGKTSGIAAIALWWIGTKGGCRIICTAAKEDQLKFQLWPELRKWRDQAIEPWKSDIIIDARTLYLLNNEKDSFGIAHVARIGHPESLQGYHHDNLLQIVDEASGISDAHMEAIESTLTKPGN